MSAAGLSIFVFSIYEIILGVGFLFFPNKIFRIFKIPATTEPWIKIVGALALVVGYYNLMIGHQEIEAMFMPSIIARVGFMVVIIYLVNFQKAPKILYLFALMDLLAIGWTFFALN